VAAVPVWLAFWSVVLDGVMVELLDGVVVAVPVVSVELVVPELLVLAGGCVGCVD
jgi:hypothetical protein